MAGYDDTRQMIISTLMGRPVGTEIQDDQQQAYELNMLDYIRSLELLANGPLIGIATPTTQPIQPDNSRVCYVAGVAQDRTVTFQNFRDYLGQPIQITNGEMEACLVILIWDTQYWSAETIPTSIISQSEQAVFYYRYNVRKTYSSVSNMNSDAGNPIGDDGKKINIGDLVSVMNSANSAENGTYSYLGAQNGWKFQGSMNVNVSQERGQSGTEVMSQRAVTNELKAVEDEIVQLAVNTYISNINFEQGSFSASSGAETDATNRVRSQMLSYELYEGFRLNAGYKFLTVRAWDKSRNYVGSIASETFRSDSREIRLTDRNDISYIRFVVIRDDNGDLTPSSDFEIEVFGIKKTIDNRIDKQLLPTKFFDASILTIPNVNIRISDGTSASSSITIATDYVDCAGYDLLQIEMLVGTTEPIYGLAFYDFSKGFIQSFPRPVGVAGSSFVGYDIPSNSAYFRVAYYADTSNQKPFTAQLIKSKDEYIEFNGIVPDKTNSAVIRSGTGVLDLTLGETTSATDYADVGGVDKIRLPMISGNSLSVTSGLAFYDENKDYITGHLRPYSVISPHYMYMTYDVPEGAVYVRSTWYSDTFLEEHPDFPDFRIGLIVSSKKELGLLHNTAQRVRELENKVNVLPYFISGDFSKTYKFDYLGPTGSAMANLTMEYAYGLYDALQAEFPEMIERNLLGYATGTDGSPNVSYPIYEYHLKKPEEPAYYQNNTPLTPPPVILLLTGVHGLEKISVQSVYEFINAMLHTWRENDLLENLLFNFQYKIIPLANPWGYDNSIRNNARNVNINRNFEYNWEGQGYANERGEYPLSELETQILANWFENNKDALIEIDFHDTRYTDTSQNGLITYQATVNEYIPKVYSSYIRKMSRRWIDRYNIDTNYRVMGRVGYEPLAGTYTQAHYIAKIRNTSIIEINRTLWGQDYSQVACEISCEQVVNYLCALIDYEIQRG